MKALGLEETTRSHRTSAQQIRAALKELRFRMLREVYCSDWAKLSDSVDVALLSVNYYEKKNTWHWVVFDGSDPAKPILDPQSKDRRGTNPRTRLYSYYRIERL